MVNFATSSTEVYFFTFILHILSLTKIVVNLLNQLEFYFNLFFKMQMYHHFKQLVMHFQKIIKCIWDISLCIMFAYDLILCTSY